MLFNDRMVASVGRGFLCVPMMALWLATSGCSSQTTSTTQTSTTANGVPVAAAPVPASAVVSARLREIAANGRLGVMERGDFSDYRKLVQSAYEASGYAPLWLNGDQPTGQGLGLVKALEASTQKGLNPADYDAGQWSARVDALTGSTDEKRAEFDAALTVAVMRYISDLHIGRVNPKHFKFGIDVETKKYDLAAFVTQKVVNAADVQALIDEVEPPYDGYRRTEAALQQYLVLAAKGDGPRVPEAVKGVGVGDPYAGVGPLVTRLRLLGDMPTGGEVTAYGSSVSDGVKHFQERHGLAADGKLGAATVRQLNVPLADRVRQLDDALERWRWMPPEFPQPPVVVNIPEFRLRAFEGGQKIALAMNVVVGKAAPTQTPVFTDSIKYIVFRPYWNVPPSIVRSSVIPGVNRGGNSYLANQRFEVTGGGGGVPGDLVAGLRAGRYSVRQLPGPKNSLGLIKFIFPNSYNVYLHSTPATQLFSQSRRDFSHGCIRLEKPAELAGFLLRNQQDGGQPWTVERAQAAMDSGANDRQVNLTTPVPVLILYVTAVAEEDGTVHFFDDIYGHDRKLDAVLTKGPPYP
jgi:L,D-transpeptidase YcbB